MNAPKYLMDTFNNDFYISMTDYIYDETCLDIALGMSMVMMGGEI